MNLLLWIMLLLFFLSLTDFIFMNQRRMHESIFKIAFFLTFFLFSIKYYTGCDIALYVPFYENIDDIFLLVKKGIPKDEYFEPGFWVYCGLMKTIGMSFWGITFVISVLYFYVINKIFKKINTKKTFALFVLVVLEYNLIVLELRQCLTVCFFLLMVMSFAERSYLKTILFFLLTVYSHKSGAIIAMATLIVMNFRYLRLSRRTYTLLLVILVLFCVLPLKDIFMFVVEKIHVSSVVKDSITHHLLLAKQGQLVFFVYLFSICTLVLFYKNYNDDRERKIQWVVLFALVIITFMYQYYFILNRIRSFFSPILIVYIFNLLSKEKDVAEKSNKKIFSSLFVVLMYVFCLNMVFVRYSNQEMSTIFRRIGHSEEEIKKEQMEKAKLYWKDEYMQNEENKIDK